MYATEECFDFSDSYVKQLLAVLTIPLKIFVAMLPKLLSVTCPYYIFKINYSSKNKCFCYLILYNYFQIKEINWQTVYFVWRLFLY